jgi:hypothetical protein
MASHWRGAVGTSARSFGVWSRLMRGAAMGLWVLGATAPVSAAARPDATLYTSYFMDDSTFTGVTWIVCGSTQQSEGCFDSGSLGPFGKIGGMLEGYPFVDAATSTVTRHVYIVDVASGGGAGVTLYVYKKTDVVSSSFDTTTFTLVKTLDLPITGGSSAKTSMAANGKFLFVGTDQSSEAVEIQKSNYAITQWGGFSPPMNISTITTDSYGYVTMTFSGGGFTGNIQVGPDGLSRGDGGGAWFMLDTMQGFLPSPAVLP